MGTFHSEGRLRETVYSAASPLRIGQSGRLLHLEAVRQVRQGLLHRGHIGNASLQVGDMSQRNAHDVQRIEVLQSSK